MNLFEKIKMWFSGIGKIVKFLMDTYTEGKVLADKKANFKTWVDYILAVLQDALDYAKMVEELIKGEPKAMAASVSTKSADKPATPQFRTAIYREKADAL